MKITCGMGTIDDYETLVRAGADEVFCGFVPYSWNMKYKNSLPINRREVFFYHVQISSFEDMKILAKKVVKYGVKVTITFNSLYYIKEQLAEIAEIITRLLELGFRDYIISDINLIRFLSQNHIACNIHVSGELGEWNKYAFSLIKELENEDTKITRIIFHRKTDFRDMTECISLENQMEYEAFAMNENCQFTGGFCNSVHCDELIHICQVNYELSPSITFNEVDNSYEGVVGADGCGICALYDFRELGITHLKVVGRGQSAQKIAEDVRALRKAICILDKVSGRAEYISTVKEGIFHGNCPQRCYYS